MKYCPYCGAVLADDAVSFCMECGKKIPARHEMKRAERHREGRKETARHTSKRRSTKKREKKIEVLPEDNYDGYYDDILPPDLEQAREGIDTALVKKIVALVGVVFLIVALCVLMIIFL